MLSFVLAPLVRFSLFRQIRRFHHNCWPAFTSSGVRKWFICAPLSGRSKPHFQLLFAKSHSRAPFRKILNGSFSHYSCNGHTHTPNLALRTLISKKKGLHRHRPVKFAKSNSHAPLKKFLHTPLFTQFCFLIKMRNKPATQTLLNFYLIGPNLYYAECCVSVHYF